LEDSVVKTVKLNVNGKDYVVDIENPNASPLQVRVNGKPFTVTLDEPRVVGAAPIVPVIEEEDFDAYVPDMASTFVSPVQNVEAEETALAAAPAPSGDVINVVAPMPGKVLDIVAKVGDVVKHGDTLCNLEAMKMKSPIRSTADGKVVQILVSEGQNVNYNDVLFALQ
jgi:biotin carboxyl carrier protein